MEFVVAAAGVALISTVVTVVVFRRATRRRLAAQAEAAALDAAHNRERTDLVAGIDRETATLSIRVEAEAARADVAAAGEREAAWASRTLARIADERGAARAAAEAALAVVVRDAVARESMFDDLRDEFRATATELAATRRDLADATTRLAGLETELEARLEPSGTDPVDDRLDRVERDLDAARTSVAAHAAEARDLRHRLAVAQRAAEEGSGASGETTLLARIAELEAALEESRSAVGGDGTHPDAPDAAARRAAPNDIDDERHRLEAVVIDIRARLAAADVEAERLRGEIEGARTEIERLRSAADDARREADLRVTAAAARIDRLQGAARSSDRESAALVAREATISDLEQRLAALGAARTAELRRLNEKIASMERLYVEVELRDRRIAALEEEVKATAESRDAALSEVVRTERDAGELRRAAAAAQASLDKYAGIERELIIAQARIAELEEEVAGTALGDEMARLRRTVEAERSRADRAVQRSALGDDDPATYAAFDRTLRQRLEETVSRAVAPLQSRIDHLHAVVLEKERRIAALTAGTAAPFGPDDLTRIRGIGPKISAILHGLGVLSFSDIARFTDDDVARIGSYLPVYGRRILDDDWISQARTLAG